jgi:hypothetical protein
MIFIKYTIGIQIKNVIDRGILFNLINPYGRV